MEDIPSAGSLTPRCPTADYPKAGAPNELYAAKHDGFVSFANVNRESLPALQRHLVGFRQLEYDLAADTLPMH